MWHSIPDFGSGLLLTTMVAAAYTLAVSVASAGGHPRLLSAARKGAYGTVALVAVTVLMLAYAFVSHDFRISYVARYSDRSMPTAYLLAALWGGQDGSLLWWLFLLSLYIGAVLWWMRGRYVALQPYVIATLMSTVLFFTILMAFAANPFSTALAGSRLDGEGLNPLLQNFYMAIHPPSLYLGFVGCTVPFAFAVAALVSGRLNNEWIVAVRKWMLFAWLFLSIGNALGMLWAYVELGWGGYWAWDPVENASFLPWLTATAYVHSTMIQERRNMLKVWNLLLICLTFFLTIFGTFLTRSGVIASVHSFAQSDIGTYFLWYLGLIAAATVALIAWRLPQLKAAGHIESPLSREAAFVANNWALLGATLFVLVATTFPMISEALLKETVTVGPTFYNRWMVPVGLTIFLLMGLAPLFGWRKTSKQALRSAFIAPVGAALAVGIAHVLGGSSLGFPAFVPSDPIVGGSIGRALQAVGSATPVITSSLAALNLVVVVQEFYRGARARRSSTGQGWLTSLVTVVSKARRRYGGYVVHTGITLMFIGFLGQAWGSSAEASLAPGEHMNAGGHTLTYKGAREQVDATKQMLYADVTVLNHAGNVLGSLSPAKFVFHNRPEQPTTEVAVLHTLREDVYVVLGSVVAETQRVTLQVHINPLVSWIWVGVVVLILGASISLWPEVSVARAGVWGYLRFGSATIVALLLSLLLAALPARAFAFGSTSRLTLSAADAPAPANTRLP